MMVTRVTAALAGKRPARTLSEKTAPRKPEKPAVSPPSWPHLPDERMSKVDTAWLRMDNPGNLMQITGVWQLVPARCS